MNKKAFFLLLFTFLGCATLDYGGKEKAIKSFRLERPLHKISIGILYFKDVRQDYIISEEFSIDNFILPKLAVKLTENILKKEWNYATVVAIPMLELPDLNNEKEYKNFKKKYGVDFVLLGEIEEGKIEKIKTRSSNKYKLSVFLNKGFFPQTFKYEARVKLKGKVISLEDKKVIWEEKSRSILMENKYLTGESLLISATNNAIGKMLQDMSKIFTLNIREIS